MSRNTSPTAPAAPAPADMPRPAIGQVTWDSEGTEGGRYHSRVPHVPGSTSGLTIGRGYDLKHRNAGQVVNDLVASGVDMALARRIAAGHGISGDAARNFIAENQLDAVEISPQAQKVLFERAYRAEETEARRLATKPDVTKKYGKTDWDKLHPAIREMVVDLKFRGDYGPAQRTVIQPAIAANDLERFARLLSDAALWGSVPPDRFRRRREFISKAVAAERATRLAAQPAPGFSLRLP
ncbi:hypothetical protein ACI7BZ_06015 [Xanthobacter sp. AM11]|uniref:hypothetical protein n=1 Tax=Xanthobacter sp. AM11 TaxID=3380643 RepID=UPI0039BF8F02